MDPSLLRWLRLLLLLVQAWPSKTLRCKMCTLRDGVDQAVTSDNLRIMTDLRRPHCFGGYEEVECNSYQDACIKLVVQMMDDGKYWLAKGCTRKMPFAPTGCHQVHTETQEAEVGTLRRPGFMHTLTGSALQDVCICDTDGCNRSYTQRPALPLMLFLPLVIAFQHRMLR